MFGHQIYFSEGTEAEVECPKLVECPWIVKF